MGRVRQLGKVICSRQCGVVFPFLNGKELYGELLYWERPNGQWINELRLNWEWLNDERLNEGRLIRLRPNWDRLRRRISVWKASIFGRGRRLLERGSMGKESYGRVSMGIGSMS